MANDIFNDILGEVAAGETSLARPEPVDPIFNAVAEDMAKADRIRQEGTVREAMKARPEIYADHKRLSEAFGVNLDFVQRNEKTLKPLAGAMEMRSFLATQPKLSGWYSQGDNPAAIKFDELRHLGGLSWLWTSAREAFGEGMRDVDLSTLRYRQMMGEATGDEIARADALSGSRVPRSFGADSWLEKGWIGLAQMVPSTISTLAGGFEGGVAGAGVGAGVAALAGQAGPQVAFPEELLTVPAGLAAGFTAGSIAGQARATFKLEAGLAYDEFIGFKDENGQPLDPDVAKAAAVVAGSANALLETLSFRKLASTVPGLDRVAGTLSRDAIASALTRPTVRAALKNFAVNTLSTMAVEVSTEVMQEAITIFAGEAAKGYDGEFQMLDAGDVAGRIGETFEQTLQAMTIMGPLLAGSRLGHDVTRARASEREQSMIGALIDHAQGNELNARLPEKSKEAIRALTENGPVQFVYVDPTAIQTYFQTAEEASAFAASAGITEEYNEAIRLGRDVEIPIENYYVNIAGTEIGTALKAATKLSPEAMFADEAQAFNDAWAEAQASLRADYEASQAQDRTVLEGEERVFEDVKNKAMDAGIIPDQATQYAKLYSAFFRVMAERTGQDAGELYAHYGVDIKRALNPSESSTKPVDNLDLALELIRRGRVDPMRKAVEKASGPSLLQAIAARGGIVDAGGDLKAIGADKIKGVVREADTGQADLIAGEASDLGDFNMFSADDTVRQMWEEGYFPEFTERPDASALFDAIGEEIAGRRRFSATQTRANDPQVQQAAGLVQFADMLDAAGIDVAAMDNDAIREAIDALVNADPDTAALYQMVADTDYRGAHGAPDAESGSPIYDVTANGIYPDDFYSPNGLRYYGTGSDEWDGDAYRKIVALKGKPDELVKVWRAIPWEGKGKRPTSYGISKLNPGDWVTISRAYAVDHGESALNGDYAIVAVNVRARDLYTAGDSLLEWGWSPADTSEYYQTEGAELGAAAGKKRGSIQLGEGRTIINLFEAADLSTFLHESGHFFLEVFRDLAMSQPVDLMGPQRQLVADWQTTREYLGIGDDGSIPVEAHEKFARTFEAYLFEGKAPSAEVAGIFARFRSWLVFVYRNIRNLNAPINDKIRGVMDRLVATDEEIKAAMTGPEFHPAFTDQQSAGMTDAQWSAYTEAAGRAVERARREMDQRMLSEIARETTAEWRAAKKEIRDDVRTNMEKAPVYRALSYLRGKAPDAVPGPQLHLDKAAIVGMFNEGALFRLPKGVPPIYRAKGGVHPDVVAELFGFKSGHDMLSQMMSAAPLGRAIVDETAARMKARYGDLMGDAVARARVAEEAIANDATGELLAAEMEVLVRKGLVTTKATKEGARRLARELVRAKPLRQAIRAKLYMNANQKAAAEAEAAIRKEDWRAAISAKQRQLLNHYMAMEAREAEKDAEAAVKYLNRFAGRKRPKGVRAAELDQIDALLERFDLRKSVTMTDAARRAKLSEWIAEQEAAGELPAIPEILAPSEAFRTDGDKARADRARADAFRKPYKEMTIDDLMAVRDAVKSIEHIGRRWAAVEGDVEAREWRGRTEEAARAIATSQKAKKLQKTRNPTTWDKTVSTVRSLESALLKLEQVFDWMDSGDVHGPMHRYVWQPIADAEARENDMRKEYTARFQQIVGKLDRVRLNERVSVPGVSQTFTRAEIMAVALNTGNESNLDKMMRGEGWQYNPGIVDRLLAQLNADEANAVQEIWDAIDSLWPEIAKLQKKLSGVEPPKIAARPVEIAGVKLRGGYYPMIYDPDRSHDVEDRAAAQADRMFENTYLRPETHHGFTKERQQAYARPVLFSLDGAAKHVQAVIHDVTHREALLNAHKLLTNAGVRTAIEATYGREIYQQMVPWLQSIAHDAYRNDGLNAVNRVLAGVRSRASMMGMGFRFTTMFSQVAGLSSSLEMVPVKAMAGALKDFTMSPAQMWEDVNRLSGEMRYRSANLDRDIRDGVNTLGTSPLDHARRFAFYGIGFLDRIVSVPTWTAAYRDHLGRNPGDEAGAVQHADKVIRLTQGAGGAKDLPAVMRKNETVKLLTMFYSYFSAYYNRQRAWMRDAHRKITTGQGESFASLLARQVFMTVGPAIVAELLVGRGPDEEDDEGYLEWAAKRVAFYPVSAVPVVRDAFGVLENGFGYSFTPAARVIDEVLIQPFKLFTDIVEGDATPRKVTKQTIETVGYALRLPAGQLSSSVDNVWKAIEEDDFQLRDLVLPRPAK